MNTQLGNTAAGFHNAAASLNPVHVMSHLMLARSRYDDILPYFVDMDNKLASTLVDTRTPVHFITGIKTNAKFEPITPLGTPTYNQFTMARRAVRAGNGVQVAFQMDKDGWNQYNALMGLIGSAIDGQVSDTLRNLTDGDSNEWRKFDALEALYTEIEQMWLAYRFNYVINHAYNAVPSYLQGSDVARTHENFGTITNPLVIKPKDFANFLVMGKTLLDENNANKKDLGITMVMPSKFLEYYLINSRYGEYQLSGNAGFIQKTLFDGNIAQNMRMSNVNIVGSKYMTPVIGSDATNDAVYKILFTINNATKFSQATRLTVRNQDNTLHGDSASVIEFSSRFGAFELFESTYVIAYVRFDKSLT